jgi:hypothetical protein
VCVSANVKEPFPFGLAFAMIVHKAQGRTIKRVIIDLTDHPKQHGKMEYAAVFVALSRVKHSDHLRLLEKDPFEHDRSLQYKSLSSLKPDPDAAAFLHGHFQELSDPSHPDGAAWDPFFASQHSV